MDNRTKLEMHNGTEECRNVSDWLKKIQYFYDEGFDLDFYEDYKNIHLCFRVVGTEDRYGLAISKFKSLCWFKKKIDTNIYHGSAKNLAEKYNDIIEDYKPPKLPPNTITRLNPNII